MLQAMDSAEGERNRALDEQKVVMEQLKKFVFEGDLMQVSDRSDRSDQGDRSDRSEPPPEPPPTSGSYVPPDTTLPTQPSPHNLPPPPTA